ncbi:hypothetical protein, partial [Burkholderia gladioli]|uniref:hypothetical protein n=1 Tax=Burkholderia gladioli TaxID=28095 RepID=UPI001ABBB315
MNAPFQRRARVAKKIFYRNIRTVLAKFVNLERVASGKIRTASMYGGMCLLSCSTPVTGIARPTNPGRFKRPVPK